jgi:GNAT superfamily N-acetyltransferase
MERQIIPMSFDEYEVIEPPFGWKVEYWDGHAHFTPRTIGVTTRLKLSPQNLRQHSNSLKQCFTLIPAHADYRSPMVTGYFEAFVESVEFYGWPPEKVQTAAEKDIRRYFDGARGQPLSASVIALEPDSQALLGLALFILKPEQRPHLDLLYVRPQSQRSGIATAMVNWGVDRLLESGFQDLSSAYHICNDGSRLWHHQYGFEDNYDQYYIRLKVSWLNAIIWRREKLGRIDDGMTELVEERDRWSLQLDPDDRY